MKTDRLPAPLNSLAGLATGDGPDLELGSETGQGVALFSRQDDVDGTSYRVIRR